MEKYVRVGGKKFVRTSSMWHRCRGCNYAKYINIDSGLVVCIRCDVTPEAIGIARGSA